MSLHCEPFVRLASESSPELENAVGCSGSVLSRAVLTLRTNLTGFRRQFEMIFFLRLFAGRIRAFDSEFQMKEECTAGPESADQKHHFLISLVMDRRVLSWKIGTFFRLNKTRTIRKQICLACRKHFRCSLTGLASLHLPPCQKV